jgi:ribosomal protein S18 acetylase RimI-like enzyme
MDSRPARSSDVGMVTRCITLAFEADPVWSVALARQDGRATDLEPYWRLFVEGALRYGTVHLLDEGAAVSIWLPPYGSELSETQAGALERLLERSLDGAGISAIHELYGRFEASRAGVPASHYYLSLLATDPDHRGRGVGQALLGQDLARWDAAGVPSYLESTNPANDHRYERVGFRAVGGFDAVRDGARITAMWRPAGGRESS